MMRGMRVCRTASRLGFYGSRLEWGRTASGEARPTPDIQRRAENKEDESLPIEERPKTAAGGFVRGLFGGQQVAAEDDYIARAKEQGIEVPPPSPRVDMVHIRRRSRQSEDEGAPDDTIRGRIFSRFKESKFMKGAFEAQERIKERIDESNNPVLNFFRGIYDRVFAENEHGQVIRAVRETDPTFQISQFLKEMEESTIETILKAYLTEDDKKLAEMCVEPAYDMLLASIRERQAGGFQMDPNILAVDDVQFMGGTFLGESPVLLLQFSVQQINCVRDKTGKVIEGKEDDIRSVYYAWALCREFDVDQSPLHDEGDEEARPKVANSDESSGEHEKAKEDGTRNDQKGSTDSGESGEPKPWKLMEMVIRGAHSTI